MWNVRKREVGHLPSLAGVRGTNWDSKATKTLRSLALLLRFDHQEPANLDVETYRKTCRRKRGRRPRTKEEKKERKELHETALFFLVLGECSVRLWFSMLRSDPFPRGYLLFTFTWLTVPTPHRYVLVVASASAKRRTRCDNLCSSPNGSLILRILASAIGSCTLHILGLTANKKK